MSDAVRRFEEHARKTDAAMKRLQSEFEQLQEYKKLGHEDDASAHGTSLPLSPELEKVFTEHSKLKYQLGILQRATEKEAPASGSGAAASSAPAAAAAPTLNLSVDDSHAVNLLQAVSSIFAVAITTAFPGVRGDPAVFPSSSKLENPGMYQCNAAMAMAKELKGRPDAPKTPRDVAAKIVQALPPNDIVEKTDIAGPGFINIHVKRAFVAAQLAKIVLRGVLPPVVPSLRVIVDYSSPNIAKEMHVGHLRSTIIGDCLAQVFRFVGHDVLALNHMGDWGTQFGMLISHLKDKFPNYLAESPPIQDLQTFYKESKARFDADAEFNKHAHDEVVKLQSGDPDVTTAWKLICDVSRKEFARIYERLGIVGLVERGESFYQPYMTQIVQYLTEKGLVIDDPENPGRKIMWTDASPIPLIVVKSDGGFTYDTSDLAALKYRLEHDRAQWLVYVVDVGQSEHFSGVFGGARKAGLYDPATTRVDHVGFGVVLGSDRKRFKTRSGDTVRLKDLLDEGVARAKEALERKAEERRQRGQDAVELTEEERAKVYEAVAYGCIKYADLSHNRIGDYVFSFDKMLDDKGNTAVYLLYALTRIRSIVRQTALQSVDLQQAARTTPIALDHPKELQLAQLIMRFPELIMKILKDLLPNLLCEYMYELCTAFSEFYDNCYVIEKDATSGQVKSVNVGRLLLCDATARVLERCFALLSIRTVEKM